MDESDIATMVHDYENNQYYTDCFFSAFYEAKNVMDGISIEKHISYGTVLSHKDVKIMAKKWHKNLPDKIVTKVSKEPYLYRDFRWSYEPRNYYRKPIKKDVAYTLDD